jgi:hypothetical protein
MRLAYDAAEPNGQRPRNQFGARARHDQRARQTRIMTMNRLVSMAAALLCLTGSALAGESKAKTDEGPKTEVAIGLICDTAQQVERYVHLYKDGTSAEAAMEAVNKEEKNPKACAIVAAAFVVGEAIQTVSVSGGAVQVVAITIVAAHTGRGGWKSTTPTVQYTAMFLEGQGI